MPRSKTPGPDGFPAEFFKAAWSIIGREFSVSVLDFFHRGFMPTCLNSTSLILIPKSPGVSHIKDFRPIACLNTQYKVITRLLSDRLKPILPDIILPNQTAFVKDRLLMENVLLASEIIQGYHLNSGPRCITLKIDISKAFDSVRWDFLLSSLQAYHIPIPFINCLRACVCSPTFSLTINGVTSGYFKGKTGLRQGDPLSPILFVMVMNILSLMLNKAATNGTFNLHHGCEDINLTHLCFADDLLVFLDGSGDSLEGILKVLDEFEQLSGLAININKTSLFASGIPDNDLQDIDSRFGLKPESLPIRYLGTPLSSKRLSVSDFDPLLLQIKKKITSWTVKTLSLAGRYTLISSVITGIVGFWTSAFILPKRVHKKINSLLSSFFWHGTIGISTGAKVSWHHISFPKSEGGLGIRNFYSWNQTCGLKLIWMLFFRSGSIWVAWIRRRYLSTSPFWALNEKNYSFSWIFRKLLKLRPLALRFLSISIGNGDSSFFWWDPWTPFGPLYLYLGEDGPSRLGIPLFATVSELYSGSGWSLPPARTTRQLNLQIFLTTQSLTQASDSPQWSIESALQNSFNSALVWNVLREHKPPWPLAKLIWFNAAIPRHAMTAWLFGLNRNPTLVRIHAWNPETDKTCLLCGLEEESRDHLFFQCQYSSQVWTQIMGKLGLPSPPTEWEHTTEWIHRLPPPITLKTAVIQAWQGAIYLIWQERNRRFHDGQTFPPARIMKSLISLLRIKALALSATGRALGDKLLFLWSGE